MEMLFSECSIQEWATQTQMMFENKMSNEAYIAVNTFCSHQFIGEEIPMRINHRAYCVQVKDEEGNLRSVAWVETHFVSDEVIRIRNLYVQPEFRNKGVMTFLVKGVISTKKSACKKFMVFARKSAKEAFLKTGFKIEPRFEERKAIIFDPLKNVYTHQEDPLILMYFNCVT